MTSRTTDPATSQLGSVHIAAKLPTLKAAFIAALKAIGPATANEIAQWCVQHGVTANAESVRKRAAELINDGLAKYGPSRTCKVTGQLAGTLELTNGNSLERLEPQPRREKPVCETDGRSGTGNHRQSENSIVRGASGKVEGGTQHDSRHSSAVSLSTPEAERIKSVVEFMRGEREFRVIFEIAVELHTLSKSCNWTHGTSNEYIAAIEAAAAQGLIERKEQKVRALRIVAEKKVIQQGLFDD